MLDTAREVARLHPEAVKIHLLHVNRDTVLEQMYLSGEYTPLSREEYIDIVISQLEYLPQDIVIERITGDADKKYLVAPQWSADKIAVLGGIDKELILMSHLDVMLSMDSSNMHLASLVGTPVVSVWGATHPYAGFMGWGQSESNAVMIDMPCRPCSIYGNKICTKGDYPCLTGITPEQIAGRVDIVLLQEKRK